jgi:hypothetical protein
MDDPGRAKVPSRATEARLERIFDWIRLTCVECGRRPASHADALSYRAYLTDDKPHEIGLYCPECAGKEAGSGRGRLAR